MAVGSGPRFSCLCTSILPAEPAPQFYPLSSYLNMMLFYTYSLIHYLYQTQNMYSSYTLCYIERSNSSFQSRGGNWVLFVENLWTRNLLREPTAASALKQNLFLWTDGDEWEEGQGRRSWIIQCQEGRSLGLLSGRVLGGVALLLDDFAGVGTETVASRMTLCLREWHRWYNSWTWSHTNQTLAFRVAPTYW